MTPHDLAIVHAKAFAPERGWSPEEIASLCCSAHVQLFEATHGFALVRVVADEAELLTLAVDPDHRRHGIAESLMRDWMKTCHSEIAFLEVAEDNTPAIALYTKLGFKTVGRRKAYYARRNTATADALLMQTTLTSRRYGQSTP